MPRPLRALTPELSPAHRFGAALRTYREKKSWSQGLLASMLHVSPSLVSRMEKGQRISTLEVVAVCDEFLDADGELTHLWSIAAALWPGKGRPRHGSAPSGKTARESSASGCSWHTFEDAVHHVERALEVRLDVRSAVRSRSVLSAQTDRGTWVRIEQCEDAGLPVRNWGGTEASAGLRGVCAPAWLGSLTWRDTDPLAVWRADETALVEHRAVEADSVLRVDPQLPEPWWRTWSSSLDAMASHRSARLAVAGGEPITDEHIARVIAAVWPRAALLRIDEWASAHGGMDWAHVTGPACVILGWRSWGRAPRGLDAATLWSRSLLVPGVARRIWNERRADLESPTGTAAAFYALARVLTDPQQDARALAVPARAAAARLLLPPARTGI